MQTMFVITGLTHQDPAALPTFENAHNAALQAVRTAAHMAPTLGANSIYLGGEPRGYIQGNQNPRADSLTSLTNTLIKNAYRTITRRKDEYHIDLVYRTGANRSDIQAPPHPAVIRHSWNNTDRLVELALSLDPHYQPDPGIFPHALLTHEGLMVRPTPIPTTDVFGDPLGCTMHEPSGVPPTRHQWDTGQDCPHTVNRYFQDNHHGQGQTFAVMPMIEMAHAQYRADYVRTLADHPGQIAIQLSWE